MRAKLSLLIFILLPLGAWAESKICLRDQEILIAQRKAPEGIKKPMTSLFLVCYKKDSPPRRVSRGELYRMYNATKGNKSDRELWAALLGTSSSPDEIFVALKKLSDDLLTVDESNENLNHLGAIYSKHIFDAKPKVPRPLSPDETVIAMAEMNGGVQSFINCIEAGAIFSASDGGNGCYCGKKLFKNYVDYLCQNKKVVRRDTLPNETQQKSKKSSAAQ